ncbi:MAG: HNH endonuclease [Saprospiraceae bacterium]
MSASVSKKNREYVAQRAEFRCEYCLMPEKFSLFTFHIDHIRSIKHGGSSSVQNLAYSCGFCNGNKGTDLGTFLDDDEALVRFFNPRKDIWQEHFEVIEGAIHERSRIGKATVIIFRFNDIERVLERKLLISGGFIHL